MPSPITPTTPPAWWVTRAWDWTDSWRRPPDPAKSAGFLETRQWALDYDPPREGEDYTLALEYAEKRYEEMLNLSEVLDKKLEGLARTSLAIGVLIATVARALGSNTPLGRSPLLIWAVISFALSVLVAVWSRSPTIYGTPLEIRDLLKVMDDHPELTKNKTEAVLASSYHVALVGTYATNEWKADSCGGRRPSCSPGSSSWSQYLSPPTSRAILRWGAGYLRVGIRLGPMRRNKLVLVAPLHRPARADSRLA